MEPLEGPRYPQLWFGDGMWVQLIRKKKQNDNKGRSGWLFMMRPSKELLKTYGAQVKEQIDEETGYIIEWYPERWVKILSDDPVTGKILIKCDFLRRPTPLCNESADKDQTIEDIERLNDTLKSANSRLHEEMEEMQTNLISKMNKDVEIINLARKAGGKIKSEEDEADQEK